MRNVNKVVQFGNVGTIEKKSAIRHAFGPGCHEQTHWCPTQTGSKTKRVSVPKGGIVSRYSERWVSSRAESRHGNEQPKVEKQ